MAQISMFNSIDAVEDFLVRSVHPASLAGALFYLVLFLLLGLSLDITMRRVLRAARSRSTPLWLDPTVTGFVQALASVAIWIIMFVAYAHLIPVLRNLGTAFLAGASVISIVVGLAAQNTLGNLVAGFALLLYRPFRVGDLLQVNAPAGVETGMVESLSLGYTVLKTFDNRRIVLPNSGIANQVIVNLSSVDPRVMVIVPISIAYGANIDRARELLLKLAAGHRAALEPFSCPVVNLSVSSVDLSLRLWCSDSAHASAVKSELLESAIKLLHEAGFEMSFPNSSLQLLRDVSLDKR